MKIFLLLIVLAGILAQDSQVPKIKGLTTSVRTNLIDSLTKEGYDVNLENLRTVKKEAQAAGFDVAELEKDTVAAFLDAGVTAGTIDGEVAANFLSQRAGKQQDRDEKKVEKQTTRSSKKKAKEAARAAKKAERESQKATKIAAKKAKREAKQADRAAKKAAKQAALATKRATKKADREAKKAAKQAATATKKATKKAEREAKQAARTSKKANKKDAKSKSKAAERLEKKTKGKSEGGNGR